MRVIQMIGLALTIIGAINWGLIGFFKFDLVATIFGGQGSFLSRLMYALVGISGLVCISLLFDPEPKSTYDMNRVGKRNLNYFTEFGEDEDLSDLKKD
ncbi:DUF378 domain-containing protein [Neobacillus ginsengisoli]|uniref:Uncharacterized membrane protein YuzA (DUF378 family) n=1 Tax=Neobacillus ginsengisoli TaxID=904295 RepID=A0ABT9XQ39_9BACI|nr:DUF378 domain-containing protein [Neobacillus ginsengisoli]MDQ0197662.1 uncharacterized membrane protein YuzA (DUF378 family) [Neobacillus ginsengisoli]